MVEDVVGLLLLGVPSPGDASVAGARACGVVGSHWWCLDHVLRWSHCLRLWLGGSPLLGLDINTAALVRRSVRLPAVTACGRSIFGLSALNRVMPLTALYASVLQSAVALALHQVIELSGLLDGDHSMAEPFNLKHLFASKFTKNIAIGFFVILDTAFLISRTMCPSPFSSSMIY